MKVQADSKDKEAVRAFRKAGFRVVREGNHISMSDSRRIIIIPRADPINAFERSKERRKRVVERV